MTVIIDTSVWIALFKDKSGRVPQAIKDAVGVELSVMMPPPVRLELLQGCRGEAEWAAMKRRVEAFELLAMTPSTWDEAARTYFELRQSGVTIHSSLDCCIAQLAIEHHARLIHNDGDFDRIAVIRPLRHTRLKLDFLSN